MLVTAVNHEGRIIAQFTSDLPFPILDDDEAQVLTRHLNQDTVGEYTLGSFATIEHVDEDDDENNGMLYAGCCVYGPDKALLAADVPTDIGRLLIALLNRRSTGLES